MKLRNAANSAWITLFQLDGEWSLIPFENGTAAAPSIYFKDSGTDTGIFSPGTDQVGISAGGTSRFEVSTTATTSTLPVVHPLGAVGTPSITFTGDLNTGIYSPAADTIAFVEGGAEAMRIDSSSRVGIGTTSPGNVLHVQSSVASSDLVYLYNSGSTGSDVLRLNTEGIGSGTLIFDAQSAGSSRFVITGEGRVGIGTTTPAAKLDIRGSGPYTYIVDSGANQAAFVAEATNSVVNVGSTYLGVSAVPLALVTGSIERARIDTSGRLLVGTSSYTGEASLAIKASSAGSGTQAQLVLQRGQTNPAPDLTLGVIKFADADSTGHIGAEIAAQSDGGFSWASGDYPTRLVFSTTADGASSPTERFRIDNLGLWSAQAAAAAQGVNANSGVFTFRGAAGSSAFQIMRFDSGGYNGAACAVSVGANSTNSRSINAGGSINASGADYAEYMIKCDDFEIAKGDICGVDHTGKLTNVFDDAIGFLVKSTNPSYVGGDTWGTEDVVGETPSESEPEALAQWQEALETERQKVDRIAFAGQVPVNVTGATPGQYIVPVATEDGGITGIAKNEADLTLAEYVRAVGKVIAIEDDGRARIIVKVA
jgi:hypothetical protein